jgi:tRNA modification GTPase
LVLWFPGPKSFTGEDAGEFQIHGGRAVVAGVIESLGRIAGLRLAEPGEFTRRAFDNGILDLSEVEGLADLIAAETAAQRRQALQQLDGGLSRRIGDWTARLTRALAFLEAAIDFADEDLPGDLEERIESILAPLREEIADALADRQVGERLRDGLSVAILGAPNAGKSSLLNALSRRDVAIVSERPGTTRDLLEVALDLEGLPVTLVDTAGLREGESGLDPVEREGMRRARARAAAADLKLVLFDLSALPDLDAASLEFLDASSLVVLTKSDLWRGEALPGAAPGDVPGALAGHETIPISVVTGAGLDRLTRALGAAASSALEGGGMPSVITRERHRRGMEEALAGIWRSREAAELAMAAEDLRLALSALGRVVGQVGVEDLLDVIFREFCIGK